MCLNRDGWIQKLGLIPKAHLMASPRFLPEKHSFQPQRLQKKKGGGEKLPIKLVYSLWWSQVTVIGVIQGFDHW